MKTKKAIASLVVIVLVIAVLLSIGALADQSNTSSYRINVTTWSHGIDNFYIWAFGVMTTGANAGKSGYVAEPYLTPNN